MSIKRRNGENNDVSLRDQSLTPKKLFQKHKKSKKTSNMENFENTNFNDNNNNFNSSINNNTNNNENVDDDIYIKLLSIYTEIGISENHFNSILLCFSTLVQNFPKNIDQLITKVKKKLIYQNYVLWQTFMLTK